MHYTQDQINIADSIPIMDILRSQNEEYKRVGSCYFWKAHDSLRFTGSKWYRFSTNEGGHAIQFCKRFLRMDFPDAMNFLLKNFAPYALEWKDEGSSYSQSKENVTGEYKNDISFATENNESVVEKASEKSRQFKVPVANDHNRHVYAYLTKERGIHPEIVCYFMRTGSVYEEKERNLAVFAGKDKSGNIRNASFHGVKKNDCKEKWTAKGSDLRYGFGFVGGSNRVYVFEAPIDLMSFISLYPKDWKQNNYIALSGVSKNALEQFLWDNPNVTKVFLCLDNDMAGNEACERIFKELSAEGREFSRIQPTGKDWNEDLLNMKTTMTEGTIWGISQV